MKQETYGKKSIGLKFHNSFKRSVSTLFSQPTYITVCERIALKSVDLSEEEY